jgi:3-mercaptopyruvate sulfurtransferase SseA
MARSPKSSNLPILLIILGVLFILGAFLSFELLSNKAEMPASNPPVQTEQNAAIPRVTISEAKAAYDSGEAVFVDVRDADSYARDHIPGALSIPLQVLESRTGGLNREDWIITYCT